MLDVRDRAGAGDGDKVTKGEFDVGVDPEVGTIGGKASSKPGLLRFRGRRVPMSVSTPEAEAVESLQASASISNRLSIFKSSISFMFFRSCIFRLSSSLPLLEEDEEESVDERL